MPVSVEAGESRNVNICTNKDYVLDLIGVYVSHGRKMAKLAFDEYSKTNECWRDPIRKVSDADMKTFVPVKPFGDLYLGYVIRREGGKDLYIIHYKFLRPAISI